MDLFKGIEIPYPVTFSDDYAGREKTAGRTMMTIENHLNRRDLKMIPPEGLEGYELGKWERVGDNGEFVSPSDSLVGVSLKKWKYQRYIKDYLACVRSVDDNIGRVLNYLEANGLVDNTIIVYTGDQGFYLGDHGWYDKRFMYEESLRMPLIVKYPKEVNPGQKIIETTLNIDFGPTLLDFAGIEKPTEMHGESFAPILKGNDIENWRTSMYYHYYEYPKWHNVQPHYGIRTDRYKLIHFYYDVDIWEFYDLKEDPNELNNLYNNPEYYDLIGELKKELKEQQKKYGDDMHLDEMRKVTEKGMAKH